MDIGINVGASKEAVLEVRETILAILSSGQEQKTLRAALAALTDVCSVNNAMVSNCSVMGGNTVAKPDDDTVICEHRL